MTLQDYDFAPDGTLQLRYLLDDGPYYRITRRPGADITDLPDELQTEARKTWKASVVKAYDAAINAPLIVQTPAEIAAAEAARPLELAQVACARLKVEGFDVTGIERSTGLSMAFMLDEQTAWVFFAEPQPDTNYIVLPADGVTKYPDYIEVARAGMADLSLIVQRVQ